MFNFKFLKKKFDTNNFSIGNIKSSDIEKIRIWRNDSLRYLRQNNKISKKQQITYFEKNVHNQAKLKKPNKILFSFKKDNILIGYGGLVYISWENKNAELSFLLDPKFNSKKLYKIFFNNYIDLAIKFAFDHCKLKKIYTQTFSYRKANIKLLENKKFLKEGCLKNHIFKNNKFCDLVIQSIESKKYE